ncbi:MAG: hypothetical protein ACFE91_06180 [Promethearchaeota archaeon]
MCATRAATWCTLLVYLNPSVAIGYWLRFAEVSQPDSSIISLILSSDKLGIKILISPNVRGNFPKPWR